ncbi:MAG: hypothetical protein WAU43_18285 [Acidobacteriaceae bacterium]|jgi:hypothetical protein
MTESSTASMNLPLVSAIESAAKTAGLVVLSTRAGSDFNGAPTSCFVLALSADTASDRTLQLELSNTFDPAQPALLPELTSYLRESALRFRNPRPDCYVTLAGLPIRFADFRWPFHRSTSGSDTYVVHGVAHLEDGTASPLHAKIAASMTVTFADIVAAPEQPYAESFIYNAVRKTLDRGQMEMIKSGNRQPVPVTTRYYSRWQKKFVFSDTDDEARTDFLALKLYWLSGVLGDSQPLWIADPRDAQYLNTTTDQLQQAATLLANEGFVKLAADPQFAAATPLLLQRAEHYHTVLADALAITKPAFNEEMRHGHTNM